MSNRESEVAIETPNESPQEFESDPAFAWQRFYSDQPAVTEDAEARSFKSIVGATVTTRDGEKCQLFDLVFDSRTLETEYVVLDYGTWLSPARVYVDPASVSLDDNFAVDYSLEEVQTAPPVDSDPPLSRALETLAHDEVEGVDWGWGLPRSPYSSWFGRHASAECERQVDRSEVVLRSMRATVGLAVESRGGNFRGGLQDLVVETESWKLLYGVVTLHRWLPAPSVLVLPIWFKAVNPLEGRVTLKLKEREVVTSSRFDGVTEIDPQYALKLRRIFQPMADHKDHKDQVRS